MKFCKLNGLLNIKATNSSNFFRVDFKSINIIAHKQTRGIMLHNEF